MSSVYNLVMVFMDTYNLLVGDTEVSVGGAGGAGGDGLCAWARSGAQAFPGLLCVLTEVLGGSRAVLAGVQVSETMLGGRVSGFDDV